MKLFHAWQSAQATLLKKRESETKMKATGKTEKLPDLEREIKDVRISFFRKKFIFSFYSGKTKWTKVRRNSTTFLSESKTK